MDTKYTLQVWTRQEAFTGPQRKLPKKLTTEQVIQWSELTAVEQ